MKRGIFAVGMILVLACMVVSGLFVSSVRAQGIGIVSSGNVVGNPTNTVLIGTDPAISISDLFNKVSAKISTEKLDAGGYYSFIDSKFNYSSTFKIWESPKKAFAIGVGYAGRAKNTKDKFIGTLSYDLFKMKSLTNIPVLDLIVFEPYVTAGLGRINIKDVTKAEYDFGVGAYFIRFKK